MGWKKTKKMKEKKERGEKKKKKEKKRKSQENIDGANKILSEYGGGLLTTQKNRREWHFLFSFFYFTNFWIFLSN